jgi:hypothetical protein
LELKPTNHGGTNYSNSDSGIGVTSSPPPPNTDPILPSCPVIPTETAKLISSPDISLKLDKEDTKPNPEKCANSPAKTTFNDENRKWQLFRARFS